METAQIVLAIVMGVSGVLMTWLAIASWKRKLPLNWLAGYRTNTIMSSESIWKDAHYAAAPWTGTAAGACYLGAVGSLITNTESSLLICLGISLFLLAVAVIIGAIVAQKTAKKLADENK